MSDVHLAEQSNRQPKKQKTETVTDVSTSSSNASGKTMVTSATSFTDEDELSRLISKDDFKEKYQKFARPYLQHSIGKVRNWRDTDKEAWDGLIDLLNESVDLSAKLDQHSGLSMGRMDSQNYGFEEELAHELDVQALEARLCDVEKWHSEPTVRDEYLAPLLAILQSSGTGKSRLMNHVRKRYCPGTSRTILLTGETLSEAQQRELRTHYDALYTVDTSNSSTLAGNRLRALVIDQCRNCAKSDQYDGAVRLFFDEAQYLAHHDGFLIRLLRWITREKEFRIDGNNTHCKLTVVLAGTNSVLASSFPEKENRVATESRTLMLEGGHYDKGTVPFPPFFILRTMGCLSRKWPEAGDKTEYHSMIRYSRPLFAKLYKDGKLDERKEYEMAKKVVLGRVVDWKD